MIRKQIIELQLDEGHNAFPIQQATRDYYNDQVSPALERIFDELSSGDETVLIDQLEIDLGDLGWKNGGFTLDSTSIYQILKERIRNLIPLSGMPSVHKNFTTRSTPENACLQWFHYMETGILPWGLKQIDQQWLEKVIHQLAIDPVMIARLRKQLAADSWFAARIVRDHEEYFLQQLSEVITASRQTLLLHFIRQRLKSPDSPTGPQPVTRELLWQEVLRRFTTGDTMIEEWKEVRPAMNPASPQMATTSRAIIEEGMFCELAGLILLHPFFKHLFTHLSLLNEKNFKNIAARDKAVMLLFFIGTGNTSAKDHQLIVPKTLCGMPLHEVIDETALVLTNTDLNEATDMMDAAIAQWTIMQGTSVDALRESFVNRDGKIVVKEHTMELTVSAKGIDMLLDHLPWNLSLVNLSWVGSLIHVEWR